MWGCVYGSCDGCMGFYVLIVGVVKTCVVVFMHSANNAI